jgi:hypothetical protein
MKQALITFFALIPLLVSACATTQNNPQAKQPPVFYPEPPAPARIQYLRSYTTSEDIGMKSSAFKSFVTGEKERITTIDKPYGIATYNDKIYICDSNQTLMVFDLAFPARAQKLIQPSNISTTRRQ